jgi:protein-tyrosine-phosphatase
MGAPEVVICFERKHVVDIALRYPSLRGRTVLLARLANDREGGVDIVDPHGLPEQGYLACFRRIENVINQLAVRVDSPSPST